jgi:hypothetical protein
VSSSTGALEAVDRILNRGGDADDVLREVVAALVERGGCAWAGIAFVEEGSLVLGPEAGTAEEGRRERLDIAYRGEKVGELWSDGASDRALLERVAVLVSAHVLLGWDTGGERWEP